MKEYRYIIMGSAHELQAIEKAVNTYFSKYYKAIPKRETSKIDSVIFSINLTLSWPFSFEQILISALRKGLKNTDVFSSNNWVVDIL